MLARLMVALLPSRSLARTGAASEEAGCGGSAVGNLQPQRVAIAEGSPQLSGSQSSAALHQHTRDAVGAGEPVILTAAELVFLASDFPSVDPAGRTVDRTADAFPEALFTFGAEVDIKVDCFSSVVEIGGDVKSLKQYDDAFVDDLRCCLTTQECICRIVHVALGKRRQKMRGSTMDALTRPWDPASGGPRSFPCLGMEGVLPCATMFGAQGGSAAGDSLWLTSE